MRAFRFVLKEMIDFASSSVICDYSEPFIVHIQNQVLTLCGFTLLGMLKRRYRCTHAYHYGQSDEANVATGDRRMSRVQTRREWTLRGFSH